jgi:hypothetical protein
VTEEVEHLPSKPKALSSNSSSTQKEKKKRKSEFRSLGESGALASYPVELGQGIRLESSFEIQWGTQRAAMAHCLRALGCDLGQVFPHPSTSGSSQMHPGEPPGLALGSLPRLGPPPEFQILCRWYWGQMGGSPPHPTLRKDPEGETGRYCLTWP